MTGIPAATAASTGAKGLGIGDGDDEASGSEATAASISWAMATMSKVRGLVLNGDAHILAGL